LSWASLGGRAQAQVAVGGAPGTLDDPFAFYYAIYLPNQQLQSLRPTPIDSVNAAMVARQYYAQNDRRGLYDPVSPYSDQATDPLGPYPHQNQERAARPFRFAQDPSNADGTGPSLYYGRAAQYFPGLSGRDARAQNANTYAGRTGGGIGNRRGGFGGGAGGGG